MVVFFSYFCSDFVSCSFPSFFVDFENPPSKESLFWDGLRRLQFGGVMQHFTRSQSFPEHWRGRAAASRLSVRPGTNLHSFCHLKPQWHCKLSPPLGLLLLWLSRPQGLQWPAASAHKGNPHSVWSVKNFTFYDSLSVHFRIASWQENKLFLHWAIIKWLKDGVK